MTATALDAGGMARPDRRDVMLGGLLAMVGAGSVLLKPVSTTPVMTSARLDAAVPQKLGPWRVAATDGLVTAPEDEMTARLYDQILTRIYRAPDTTLPDMALLVACGRGQDADVQLHRPDVCYPPQGFTLSDERTLPLDFDGHAVPARIVTASRDGMAQQVVFWTRIGDRFPPDAAAERALIVRENLAGRMPDAVLVRISVEGVERGDALRAIRGFVGLLAAALPADGRRVFVDGFSGALSSARPA
jgi:EpsI family protein